MNASQFVHNLRQVSLPGVFNPYSDLCSIYDHAQSPAIRCTNLQYYLDAVIADGVDSVWFGRDCGYRGARRTGVALTDELHLEALERCFGICGIAKATSGAPQKERTATEVWKIISEVGVRVFLWNIFPFHPFEPGSSMSNRRHTRSEFSQCMSLSVALLDLLKPRNIVALGHDAFVALDGLGFKATAVRHPSYGGQKVFAEGVRRIYSGERVSTRNAARSR